MVLNTENFFSHFSLSSQLLLYPCMDLNETWQGCCTTSLEVHVGRQFIFDKVMVLDTYNFYTFLLVFSTFPKSQHSFAWYLAGMLHNKPRSTYREMIHVRQILAELWSLTLRIFTHFSLSSQLFLHPCIDLNETWQGCFTTSLELHVWRWFMFDKFWESYSPWHLEFLHILACLLNASYTLAWI